MPADARTLYNVLTEAAVEAAPKLGPTEDWPMLVTVAHGDSVTTLPPIPPVRDERELAMVCGGLIPSMIRQVGNAHAAALQWPGYEPGPAPVKKNGSKGRQAVYVLALEREVAWRGHALQIRRDVARLHPVLLPFAAPERIEHPATAETRDDFAHRCLLFSLGLLELP